MLPVPPVSAANRARCRPPRITRCWPPRCCRTPTTFSAECHRMLRCLPVRAATAALRQRVRVVVRPRQRWRGAARARASARASLTRRPARDPAVAREHPPGRLAHDRPRLRAPGVVAIAADPDRLHPEAAACHRQPEQVCRAAELAGDRDRHLVGRRGEQVRGPRGPRCRRPIAADYARPAADQPPTIFKERLNKLLPAAWRGTHTSDSLCPQVRAS